MTPVYESSRAVCLIISFTCAADKYWFASRISATTPATTGDDIEVPLNLANGYVRPLKSIDVKVVYDASVYDDMEETTCTPGAAISGFIESFRSGPMLVNAAGAPPASDPLPSRNSAE